MIKVVIFDDLNSKKIKNPKISIQLEKDRNNEYTLSKIDLKNVNLVDIYDDATKIANISNYSGKIQVEFYVKNQVNIFVDIACEELIFRSQGSVCVDAKITANNAFIYAEKLLFLDKLNINNKLCLEANRALVLESDLVVRYLKVNCEQLIVRNSLYVRSEGYVRANRVDNFGRFVAKKIDLQVDTLINTNKIIFLNDTTVKLNKFINQGEFKLNNSGITLLEWANHGNIELINSTAKIENQLQSDVNSIIILNHVEMKAKKAKLQGGINIDYSSIDSSECFYINSTKPVISHSQLVVDSLTIFNGDLNYLTINSKKVYLIAPVRIDDSDFFSNEINIDINGENLFSNCKFNSSIMKFSIAEKFSLDLLDCKIVSGRIEQYGDITFNHSLVTTSKEDPFYQANGNIQLLTSKFNLKDGHFLIFGDDKKFHAEKSTVIVNTLDIHANANVLRSMVDLNRFWQWQGNFYLDNSVFDVTDSAFIKKATLEICSSIFKTNLLNIDGDLISKNTHLDIKENTLTYRNSKFVSTESQLRLGQAKIGGSFVGLSTKVEAQSVKTYDNFVLKNSSINVNGDILEAVSNSHINLTESAIQASKAELFGQVSLSRSQAAIKNMKTRHQSHIQLDSASIRGDKYKQSGMTEVKATSSNDDKNSDKNAEQVGPPLCFSKKFKITSNGKLIAPDLMMDVESFKNEGEINVDTIIGLKGKWFHNSGKMHSKDSISLGFDRYILNFGDLGAKFVTIQSPIVMHVGGTVFATNYVGQGLLNINLGGWIAANNIYNAGLLSLNTGLMTPNLVNPLSLFTFNNLWSAGRMVATTLLPQYASIIGLVGLVPGVFSTVINTASAVYKHGRKGLFNMRPHELMPLVCQLNTAFNLGSSLVGMGTHFNVNTSGSHGDIHWNDVALNWATSLIGTQTEEALVSINTGASTMMNTMRTNVLDINSGLDSAYNNYGVNTHIGINGAWEYGGNVTYTANTSVNIGIQKGTNSLYYHVDTLVDTKDAVLAGRNANVTIDSYEQHGELALISGQANIAEHHVTSSGQATFTGIQVKGDHLDIEGQVSYQDSSVNITDQHISRVGDASYQHTLVEAQRYENAGKIEASHSAVTADEVVYADTATHQFNEVYTKATNITDASETTAKGQVAYIAKENYQHTGHYQVDKDGDKASLLYIEAGKAELNGSAAVDDNTLALKSTGFEEGVDFALGLKQYAKYQSTGTVSVETGKDLHLDADNQRHADLQLTGRSIDVSKKFENTGHVTQLKSTVAGVELKADMESKSLYVSSATDVNVTSHIHTNECISIDAQNKIRNLGGFIDSDQATYLKAQEISIIDPNSDVRNQYSNEHMGKNEARIRGAGLLHMETSGNIEMQGGRLEGDSIEASVGGNFSAHGYEHEYRDKHGIRKEYHSANIIAGGGELNDQHVAVNIQAKGKAEFDMVTVVSNGENVVSASSIDIHGRNHTYVSRDETKSSGFLNHKKTHVTETKTEGQDSFFSTSKGKNHFSATEGNFKSLAGKFLSDQGTDIYAKKDVSLQSVVSTTRIYESESSFWGLSEDERDARIQTANPTVIAYQDGKTTICAEQGSIDSTAIIQGKDLVMQAGQDIHLSKDILTNEMHEKTRSWGVSTSLDPLLNVVGHGGKGLTTLDSTLQKIQALRHANNPLENTVTASNLAIEAVNTSNSVARGLASHDLGSEALSRYGLGGTDGINPSATLTCTTTKTDTVYQTTDNGDIALTGNMELSAGQGVHLHNGASIAVAGNAKISAQQFTLGSAELSYRQNTITRSANIGISLDARPSAGASYQHDKTYSTTYDNASMNVGGHLDMAEVKALKIKGGDISANSAEAHLDTLTIESQQETIRTETQSASVHTTGQVSYYKGQSSDRQTNHTSGIHLTKGFNESDDHAFTVKEAVLTGATLTTEGANHFAAKHVTAKELHDSHQQTGIGISGNVNDFERILPNHNAPTNQADENTIATANISMDREDRQSHQQSVIHGEAETLLNISKTEGSLHTANNNGYRIDRDYSTHVSLDVPITNREYLAQSSVNFSNAKTALQSLKQPVGETNLAEENELALQEIDFKLVDLDITLNEPLLDEVLNVSTAPTEEHELTLQEIDFKLADLNITPNEALLNDDLTANSSINREGAAAQLINQIELTNTPLNPKIYDGFDETLGWVTAATEGTLVGGMLSTAQNLRRDARTFVYGDSCERSETLQDATEKVLLYEVGGNLLNGAASRGLTRFGLWGDVTNVAIKTVNTRAEHLSKVVPDFLGKDYKVKLNKSGDPIFVNADNTRRIRFDAKNPHGYSPHGHVEIKVDGRWRDYTERHHIYLREEPQLTNTFKNKS